MDLPFAMTWNELGNSLKVIIIIIIKKPGTGRLSTGSYLNEKDENVDFINVGSGAVT